MKIILGMGNKRNLATFSHFVENIKNICEYITLHFEDNRLYSQGMSEDHCSIFELAISSEWFEFYEKKETDIKMITVRTAILSKILDTRQKSQFLVIEYDGNPNTVCITLKNKPKDEITNEYPKDFEIPLISVDQELLTIPDTEYSVDFNIDSNNIRNIIEQLMLFDDVISIKCDEDTIEFSSNGEDGSLKIDLFDEEDKYVNEFALEEDYTFKSDFNAKHLYSFCKFSKLAKVVSLGFTNNYPLCFKYNIDTDDMFKLKLMLAPRIDEE